MILHEELYFEINAEGTAEDIKKFVSFITSGELEDYFEITSDYITYDDDSDAANTKITISNDDYGIEIDSFNVEDFLDSLCYGGKQILIYGNVYDIDDEEYRFISHAGSVGFENAKNIDFADELDLEARKEAIEDEY